MPDPEQPEPQHSPSASTPKKIGIDTPSMLSSQSPESHNTTNRFLADPSFTLPENIKLKLTKFLRPAYTLWTYAGFANDLLLDDLTQRKQLIRNIVRQAHKQLNWPQGSITFWPLFNYNDGVLAPDINLFHFGLELIKPVFIFCFGYDPFKILFPGKVFDYSKFYYGSYLVQVFPDFDQLLPDNRELKKMTWHLLNKYNPR